MSETGDRRLRVVAHGVDSLYLGYRFHLAQGLETALEEHKHSAKRGKRAERIHPETGEVLVPRESEWVSIAGEPLEVMPYGAQSAPYLLHGPDFHLAINPEGDEAPQLQVQLLSSALWRDGEEALIERTDAVAGELARGGQIERRYVSRLDLAVDHQGYTPTQVDFDMFVSQGRARMRPFVKDEVFGEGSLDRNMYYRTTVEGFLFGTSGRLKLRWYDKTGEIVTSHKDWMRSIWERGGYDPDQRVWRNEPQFNREFFRTGEFSDGTPADQSIEDVLQRKGELWEYATQRWLRLTLLDNDRKSRSTMHPAWRDLAYTDVWGTPSGRVTHHEQLKADAEAKLPPIQGYLASWAALAGHHSLEDAVLALPQAIEASAAARGKPFEQSLQRAARRYGVGETDGIAKLGSAVGAPRRRSGAQGSQRENRL